MIHLSPTGSTPRTKRSMTADHSALFSSKTWLVGSSLLLPLQRTLEGWAVEAAGSGSRCAEPAAGPGICLIPADPGLAFWHRQTLGFCALGKICSASSGTYK